jgi:hypothetical protein
MTAGRGLQALLPLALLAGAVVWTLQIAFETGRNYDRGSSYRSDAAGTRALYLLLEEMGQQPRRSFLAIPPVPRGLLVCLEPSGYPLERDRELIDWVGSGGVLVLGPGGPRTEPKVRFRPRSAERRDLAQRLGLTFLTAPASAAAAESSPLRAAAPALQAEQAPAHWKSAPKGAQVLLGTDAAPVLMELPFGAGRIYALAAPAWLENEGIAEGEHWRLARFLLEQARPVFFDEFRHGLAERPGLGYVLSRYGLLPAACAGLIFLGLLVWRTTPAEAEPTAEPETTEVHDSLVDVRASLYARTLTPRDAIAFLERDLRYTVSARVGGGRLVAWPEAERLLAARRPELGKKLRALMRDLLRAKSRPPARLDDVLPLSAEVAALLKEVP